VPCAFVVCFLFVAATGGVASAANPIARRPIPRGLRYEGPHVLSNALPGCHSADAKEATSGSIPSREGRARRHAEWLEIMERISSGEMPPKDAKNRPSADESAKVGRMACGPSEGRGSGRMAERGRVSYTV